MSFLLDKIREIEKQNISLEEKKKKVEILRQRIDKINEDKKKFDSKVGIVSFIALILGYVFFVSLGKITTHEDFVWLINISFAIAIILLCITMFIMIKPKKKSKHSKLRKIKNEEIDNLKNFFAKLYEEHEDKLKRERLKILGWYMALIGFYCVPILGAVIFGLFLINGITTQGVENTNFDAIFSAMFIGIMIFCFVMPFAQSYLRGKIYGAKRSVKKIYKEDMLGEFLKHVNTGLKYSETFPLESKIENDFDFLEYGKLLDSGYIDDADDYFSGYINGNFIEMADVKFVCDNLGGFNGRFASIVSANIYGDVDIIAKPKFVFNRRKYLHTGARKFDKYFLVRSDEQKELFTLFDKNFLEFLGDFTEKTGIVFDLLVKDKIYLKIYVGNIFEPKMFGKLIDEYSMYKFVMIMKLIRELAERF